MKTPYQPYKVTAHIDPAGLFWDPTEPVHLDSLLGYALAGGGVPPIDVEPFLPVEPPVAKWQTPEGEWGYCCSAFQPEGPTAWSTHIIRKRYDVARTELTRGAVSRSSGRYKDFSRPLPILLCRSLVAYIVGDGPAVASILREKINHIGKRRSIGLGCVLRWDVEPCEHDYSCVRDGIAMRVLPDPKGLKEMRFRPPYWHPIGAASVCEVGQPYRGKILPK